MVLGSWSLSTDSDGNSFYVGELYFSDAIYSINAIRYTNKAGRSDVFSLVSSPSINRFFTVDRGAPSGTVIVTPKDESESLGSWDKLLDSLTFGRWSKKTVTITKTATVKKVLKNLKSGKKYYVRIRGYKKVNGKDYYSTWSKVKSANVK